MNKNLLNQANQNWENFVNNLTDKEKKRLSEYSEPIDFNKLYYYAATEDNIKFEQTLNHLSNKFLYDEEIIQTIYKYYFERGLHELAFDYLINAEKYFKEQGQNIPAIIKTLKDQYPDEETIKKLKLILANLPSQRVSDIPKILPNNINGKKILNEFILNEIIKATKVLLDKILSIKDIPAENSLNDLLLASLRLRLPIWGWAIFDQPRVGKSSKKKESGEIDHLFQANGDNIALIEAFILTGKNIRRTQKHILKCNDYVSYLTRYFFIIYFKGKEIKYNDTWTKYQADVLSIVFPQTLTIDKTKNFLDLSCDFEDVRNFKIAKTFHNNEVEMFHVMINLGED